MEPTKENNTNELVEKICNIRNKFDELAAKYNDDEGFVDCVKASLDENEFLPQEKICEDYQKNAEKDRLLRIGIVGAVKAGKSSLLNSLFFDGKDILPKAATPMTAALTELSYGEQCEISVDFFTENDIKRLYENSETYKRELARLTAENFKLKKESWIKSQQRRDSSFKGEPAAEDEQKWKKEAEVSAESKIKNNLSLSGAYEQYKMIEKNGAVRKTESEHFTLSSISEISGKLEDYVGSNGKYMPFTSKVSIKLPIESLKGIGVIDTPGFNDPVPSRNERARKSLKDCDVVFILSPTRQFISANDKEVMSKITSKQGIRELYLISSQIDSQLFNPEVVDRTNGNLNNAVDYIKEILCNVAKSNLKTINENGVFSELLNETEKRLFSTSAICESMSKTIGDKENWDSGRKKVWENLSKVYPMYFSDSDLETSKTSLLMLGNINPIYEVIESVKSRKAEIFQNKLNDFEKKYANCATDTKKDILEYIEGRESDLKNRDIGKLEKEIEETQKSYNQIGPELKESFIDCVMEWYDEVKTDFENNLTSAKGEAKSGVSESEGSYENTWTTGRWFWKKEHSETVTTANVSAIKDSIDEYIDYYNDNMPHFLNTEIYRLTKKVVQTVQKTWSEHSSSGSDSLTEVRSKVRSVMASMNFDYDLEYKGSGFEYDSSSVGFSFFGGTSGEQASSPSKLEGDAAEDCLSKAKSFVSQLNREFKSILTKASEDVLEKCKHCDFEKQVLDGYIKKFEKAKSDLEKPKLALENFKKMKEELEKIEC